MIAEAILVMSTVVNLPVLLQDLDPEKYITTQEPDGPIIWDTTVQFRCSHRTTEVRYYTGPTGGQSPYLGSSIERITINDVPVNPADLQAINDALNENMIRFVEQSYCDNMTDRHEWSVSLFVLPINYSSRDDIKSLDLRFEDNRLVRIVGSLPPISLPDFDYPIPE